MPTVMENWSNSRMPAIKLMHAESNSHTQPCFTSSYHVIKKSSTRLQFTLFPFPIVFIGSYLAINGILLTSQKESDRFLFAYLCGHLSIVWVLNEATFFFKSEFFIQHPIYNCLRIIKIIHETFNSLLSHKFLHTYVISFHSVHMLRGFHYN